MRTTIIPAQITTVEDKIAGNLNFTQILLLMVPVLVMMILFTFMPPIMKLAGYKLWLILIILLVCLVLSLRVKGRVVFNWLLIVCRFKLRPSFWVLNKNDKTFREEEIMVIKNEKKKTEKIKATNKRERKLETAESVKFLQILTNKKNSFSFKLNSKGGLNVAFEQIQK